MTFANTIGTVLVAVQPAYHSKCGRGQDDAGIMCNQLSLRICDDQHHYRPQRVSKSACCGGQSSPIAAIPVVNAVRCGPVLLNRPASTCPSARQYVGTRSGCCARAWSGHGETAPPSSVMNSRRFNRSNCIRSPVTRPGTGYRIGGRHVRGVSGSFLNPAALGCCDAHSTSEMGHSRRRQPRPSVHALPLLPQKLT